MVSFCLFSLNFHYLIYSHLSFSLLFLSQSVTSLLISPFFSSLTSYLLVSFSFIVSIVYFLRSIFGLCAVGDPPTQPYRDPWLPSLHLITPPPSSSFPLSTSPSVSLIRNSYMSCCSSLPLFHTLFCCSAQTNTQTHLHGAALPRNTHITGTLFFLASHMLRVNDIYKIAEI